MGQSHPNHMAKNEVGSTEGNPGEPRGGGMGGGSPEAVAMIQVNMSQAWRGLGAARRKRVQKEMYRHSLLYPKCPGRNSIPELASGPMWFRTCLPRPCGWINNSCGKCEHRARGQQPPTPTCHGNRATDGAKLRQHRGLD